MHSVKKRNTVYEFTGNTAHKYLYGHSLISSESYRYVLDAHGSVVALVDSSNSVVKRYDYDAFGNELDPSSSDTNPFRYCAEYYDKETDKIYLRARYYDLSDGRFTQMDTARDGLNWYAYCGNNPVRFVDPSGENIEDFLYGFSETVDKDAFGGAASYIAHKIADSNNCFIPENNDDYYLGRLTGDITSFGVGAAELAIAVEEIVSSIASGGLVTVLSEGVLCTEGFCIAVSGVAAGCVTLGHSTYVISESSDNFCKDVSYFNKHNSQKLTSREQKKLAKSLGYEPTNYYSNGQKVFYNKKEKKYITYDYDGHNGGVWKMAKSENGFDKMSRLGTYDAKLNRIGN